MKSPESFNPFEEQNQNILAPDKKEEALNILDSYRELNRNSAEVAKVIPYQDIIDSVVHKEIADQELFERNPAFEKRVKQSRFLQRTTMFLQDTNPDVPTDHENAMRLLRNLEQINPEDFRKSRQGILSDITTIELLERGGFDVLHASPLLDAGAHMDLFARNKSTKEYLALQIKTTRTPDSLPQIQEVTETLLAENERKKDRTGDEAMIAKDMSDFHKSVAYLNQVTQDTYRPVYVTIPPMGKFEDDDVNWRILKPKKQLLDKWQSSVVSFKQSGQNPTPPEVPQTPAKKKVTKPITRIFSKEQTHGRSPRPFL